MISGMPAYWFFLELSITLLLAGCGVVAVVKWRASAAGILAGIGFGSLAAISAMFLLIHARTFFPDEKLLSMMGILRIAAWLVILISYIMAPSRTAVGSVSTYPAARDGFGAEFGPPITHRRPGWGLVTTWIVLSAFGMISAIITIVVAVSAGRYWNDSEIAGIIISVAVCGMITIASTVVYLVWLYQAWDSVPAQFRRHSPGQAVGYLFIPFFNFYWVFRAVPGLSNSLRQTLGAYQKGYIGDCGYGIGIAACVVALIPYVNLVCWPLFLIWVCMANSARNQVLGLSQPPRS